MAYTKVSNIEEEKNIKYLSKDYDSFKNQLIEFTETYFPNNFNDFSEGNPGMMFLEMAAYVGDILSFYTDTQIRESFLSLAQEKENLYNLSYTMGYKPKVTSTATVNLDLFLMLPSIIDNGGSYTPDWKYALDINEGSIFTSTKGTNFITTDTARFGISSSLDPTDVSIYKYDSSNNPQYYLIKKQSKAISADIASKTFNIGAVEQFKTLTLNNKDIISIESITDSEGNTWTEVPYLAQDTVFDDIENNAANDPELYTYNHQTPYLLKVKKVPRRFITRFKSDGTLEIQFGAGASVEGDTIITPARGGGSGDTIEEIRMNAMASFSAQQRTVTKNDYIIRTLSMPAKFGRVAKAYITQDDQITPYTGEPTRIPNPLALNLYTLGYDSQGNLSNLFRTI